VASPLLLLRAPLLLGQQPTPLPCYTRCACMLFWGILLPPRALYLQYLLSSIELHCRHYSSMFGASEDRARQFAFRKRRERVSSSGSSSSIYRSLSSASRMSRMSRRSNPPFSQQHGITSSVICPEETSSRTGSIASDENMPVNQLRQSQFGSFSAMDTQLSQMDRHRLQAEYLSHVLYEDLSLASAGEALTALPINTTQPGRNRAMGPWKSTCHLRNITARVASTEKKLLLSTTAELCSPLPMLPISPRTASDSRMRAQSMVNLRGGGPTPNWAAQTYQIAPDSQKDWKNCKPQPQSVAGPSNPVNQALPSSTSADASILWSRDPERPYMRDVQWVWQVCSSPAWTAPICSGRFYEIFLSRLPQDIIQRFLPLFGPLQSATHWTSPLANARRDFYQKLGHRQKDFDQMIIARRTEIFAAAGLSLGKGPLLNPQTVRDPPLMLYHLLEATEKPFTPGPSFFSRVSDIEAYMKVSRLDMRNLDGRSTSTPNLGQQQEYAAYPITTNTSFQCEPSFVTRVEIVTKMRCTDTSVAAAARLALLQPRLRSAKFSTSIARTPRQNQMRLELMEP
jgi:hypothetical protein